MPYMLEDPAEMAPDQRRREIAPSSPTACFAFASQNIGGACNVMTKMERWFLLVTGVIFIAVGLDYTLTRIYGVPHLSS